MPGPETDRGRANGMSIDFSSDGGFETEEPLVATSLLREDEGGIFPASPNAQ